MTPGTPIPAHAQRRHPTDTELELSVARVLLVGVLLAAVVVFAGGLLYLLREPGARPDYRHFHAVAAGLDTLPGAWRGALRLDPPSLIQLGLMVLIATPVARVLLCLVGFARQRDGLYTLVSAVVLGILLYSLLHSR